VETRKEPPAEEHEKRGVATLATPRDNRRITGVEDLGPARYCQFTLIAQLAVVAGLAALV
jgi:hypothetical protein